MLYLPNEIFSVTLTNPFILFYYFSDYDYCSCKFLRVWRVVSTSWVEVENGVKGQGFGINEAV